jgi:hypothetical protein
LEGHAGFIIKDMHHRLAIGIGQARMDVLVCSDAVRIMLVWEGTD